MKNPLIKRIPRELKQDFGKYFVIFAFMVLLISLVSGFLVAMKSVETAYYEGMDKYNVEHGHLSFDREPDEHFLQELEEKADLDLFKLFYINVSSDRGATVRIYKNRDEVNKACIMEGRLPEKADEIALDRLFAENNAYEVGGHICLEGRELEITGTVALPDYSCLYENNSDMMFNASLFSIAVMTEEGFDYFKPYGIRYNYAWKHHEDFDRYNKKESEDLSQNLLTALEELMKERGERLTDEAVDAGKLIFLDEALSKIEEQLKAAGADLSVYDNAKGRTELLQMIQTGLAEEGVDLAEKLADGKRRVELTEADIQKALSRTETDVRQAHEFLDTLDDKIIKIKDYVPAHKNHAITFTIDDIGGDTVMFVAFSYIVLIVIAFVFAVTISGTIYAEAGAIGTLRASGYTKGELLRHYLTLPLLVTLAAGAIGNLMGYTFMKKTMADLYYHSYSLLKYETVWSGRAFVLTTVVPIVLMFLINVAVLAKKLSIPPINFLRHDLKKHSRKRALRLSPAIPFMHRYRLRVILQNLPNYLTLLLGISLGGVVVIFSLMFPPMLRDYRDLITEKRLSNYQYFLNDKEAADAVVNAVTAENTDSAGRAGISDNDDPKPEKFLLGMLKSREEGFSEDDVSVYGLRPESAYVKRRLEKGDRLVSSAYAEKYRIKEGDRIRLEDPYTEKDYEFKVSGIYDYYGALALFMPADDLEETFKDKTDYAEGIFSTQPPEIEQEKIAQKITPADLTKIADQLEDSIGGFMKVLRGFGVIMFLLLMYLLSKHIIERSANAVSMAKILGFSNGEIGSIYIAATSAAVLLGLIVACPLSYYTLKAIFTFYIYTKMSGFIPFMLSPDSYVWMFVMGVLCYIFTAFLQMHKIRKIPKAQVLKNIE